LNWPEDYPQVLRERAWDRPVELLGLRPDLPDAPDLSGARAPRNSPEASRDRLYQPLWSRRLFGTGQYHPFPVELLLRARPDRPGGCTVLALDDDLKRRWFDFTVELPQYVNDPFSHPRGLFFGWHEDGRGPALACFVHLDLRSEPAAGRPHGSLFAGPAALDLRPEVAGQVAIAPLQPFEGKPPGSRPLTRAAPNYRVCVRARPGGVSVWVNDEKPVEFEPPFDPRGPLGIWVQDGSGRFRTATITAVRED
jgi:hypothetical protein